MNKPEQQPMRPLTAQELKQIAGGPGGYPGLGMPPPPPQSERPQAS